MKKTLRILGALVCALVMSLVLVACGGGGETPTPTDAPSIDAFLGTYQAISGHEGDQEFDEAYADSLRESGYNIIIGVTEGTIVIGTPNGVQTIDEFEVGDNLVSFEFDASWTDSPEPASLTFDGDNLVFDYQYNGDECQAVFVSIPQAEYDEWLSILNGDSTAPEPTAEAIAGIEPFVGYYQAVSGFEGGEEFDEAYVNDLRENGMNIMLVVTGNELYLVNPNGTAEASDIEVVDGVVHFGIDASYSNNPKPATFRFEGNHAIFDYEYNDQPGQIVFDPISEAEYQSWL